MSFQTIGLCETSFTNITFIRLLPRMNPQMTFQLKGIWTCVGTMWTLQNNLIKQRKKNYRYVYYAISFGHNVEKFWAVAVTCKKRPIMPVRKHQ